MKKILFVDDSHIILHKAAKALQNAGYDVITAKDGFSAITKIVDHNPDLIFIDIMMPQLDGYQTCALVKNNSNYRNTPVVMVSSKNRLFDRARGSVAGAQGHLNKPFSDSDLWIAAKRFI